MKSHKNEIATVNNAIVVTDKKSVNATKTNITVNVNDVYKVFVNAVDGKPCKLNYSDAKSQPYCGLPSFSVNMKKTGFMVYMNESNANTCLSVDKSLTVNVNDCDTTKNSLRNRSIKFALNQYETLCKCINAVVSATIQ